jgi:WD40 repeat protein
VRILQARIHGLKSLLGQRSQAIQTRDQLNDLQRYLGIHGELQDDLAAFEDSRLPGTCEWINHKPYYRSWTDFAVSNIPPVLWLKGRPASGKSVLAGYIIGELAKQQCDFSFFLFKHGEASKSRLSTCLRSIALQMAQKNAQVRDILLEMRDNDTRFELSDDRTIWRKIFLSGVFQAQFSQHYWIIDALDECADSPDRLSNTLVKIDPSLPLRILITSRESSDLEHIISVMGPKRCFSTIIPVADTLSDIRLLVEKRAGSLIAEAAESRDALLGKIIEKSNGSFLWTALVLNELSHAHGTEEVRPILDDVPREMKPLYLRCLENMAQTSSAKTLIKAILTWATCSERPLTVGELGEALKLDLSDSFPNLEESISALCGQLLYVDRLGKVQVVHETAREFLLDPQLESEFAVKKMDAHTRIAGSCLNYLSCDEMRPPRTRRGGSKSHTRGKRGKFAPYASAAFSHHLARSDPSSRSVFQCLHNFLKLNVLSWIEAIAETGSLTALIRAAEHLAHYSNGWAAIHSPLGPEMKILRYWSTDFVRIAAKFGDALVLSPFAIYWLIAPFCPVESAISQIAISGSRLSVVGISDEQWDDRLTCIDFHGDQVNTIAHGDEFLAVGLQSGAVALYHASSFQVYKQLDHGEPVKFIQFKPNTDFLGTCGLRHIRLWNVREVNVVNNFLAPRGPLGIVFDKDCLMVASTRNMIVSWSLQDGSPRPNRPWYELHNNLQVTPNRSPCAFSISLEHQMMAVAYRGQPIILWDLREDDYYGVCGKRLPNGAIGPYWVVDLVFSPNLAMELLAATYQDGDLVLFDPFNNQTLELFRAHCHTLASSPNGFLLAAANGRGEIMIYEFETLKLLYCVKTTACNIKQLTFSGDNLRFLDCRSSQCNVWEPIALLQNTINNDSSISTLSAATVEGSTNPGERARITAMTLSLDEEFAFCGRDDGQVALFDLQTGSQLDILYRHKARLLVHTLVWWQDHNVLISVDISNSTFAWRLKPSTAKGWIPDVELFHGTLDCGKSIVQLFVIHGSEKFVLSTREADYLWNLSGKEEKSCPCSTRSGSCRWIQHPQSSSHIICVEGATARIFTTSPWEEIFEVFTGIQMTGFELKRIFFGMKRGRMLIELSEESGAPSAGCIQLLDTSIFSLDKCGREVSRPIKVAAAEPAGQPEEFTIGALLHGNLVNHISHIIGICNDSSLVFVDRHSWVCSADLEDSTLGSSYLRHFFVPYDWFSGSKEVICSVAKERNREARDWEVLFARNDKLAIIRGGFGYFHSFLPD